MRSFLILLVVLGAAPSAAAAPQSPSARTLRFVAVFRENDSAFLLDASSGTLMEQRGQNPRRIATELRRPGRLRDWRDVAGLARLHGEWLVSGLGGKLEKYSRAGGFVKEIATPGPVATIAASDGLLWVAPAILRGTCRSFWVTRDEIHFREVVLSPDERDRVEPGTDGLVDGPIVMAPDLDAGIVFSRVLGAPVAFRAAFGGARLPVPLAYRRSKARDALVRYRRGEDDLTRYSSPVRDLTVLSDGSLVVLCNREDGPVPGSPVEVGRRVDLYGRSGRLVGTAEFPSPVLFLLQATRTRVAAIGPSGSVVSATFGPARNGGL